MDESNQQKRRNDALDFADSRLDYYRMQHGRLGRSKEAFDMAIEEAAEKYYFTYETLSRYHSDRIKKRGFWAE
jgi:hypothetical protein